MARLKWVDTTLLKVGEIVRLTGVRTGIRQVELIRSQGPVTQLVLADREGTLEIFRGRSGTPWGLERAVEQAEQTMQTWVGLYRDRTSMLRITVPLPSRESAQAAASTAGRLIGVQSLTWTEELNGQWAPVTSWAQLDAATEARASLGEGEE